jgi:hypothetical protein
MKRKANRYVRGNKYEVKIKRLLESQGWIVYKPVRTRFSQKDIFGMWDLLCWDPKCGVLYFLQLTTDKYIAEKRAKEKLKNFDIKWISFTISSPEVEFSKFGNVNLTEMVKTIKDTASEGEAS